jgi:hypothetical protein
VAVCRVHVNGAGATRSGRGVVCCQSAEGDSRPQGLAPVCVQTRQISRQKFTASRARLTHATWAWTAGGGARALTRQKYKQLGL